MSFANTKRFSHKKNELLSSFQKDDNNKNCKNNFTSKKKNNVRSIDNLHYNITNTTLFNSKKNDLILKSNENNIKHCMSEYLENQNVGSNEDINNDNNYNKLKEDFILLYNNDYVKNIKEDLLKLEIELFVEKTTELTKEYHLQLYYELLEYQLEKNKCNINLFKYTQMNKLYNKLQSMKSNKEIKKNYINKNNKIINKQNNGIFKLNLDEINFYKILINNNLNNKIEKRQKLKKLFNIILNKTYTRNTTNITKTKSMDILDLLDKHKTIDNNSMIRTRIIPKNQQTKYNNSHLNLTNSFVWENTNDISEKKLHEFYSKTHIFSPVIKIKDFNFPNTISQIKNNFEHSL
jgi:hypothetical protein